MTFLEYCIAKKIDAHRFASVEPALFNDWSNFFELVSQESFTQQKKFLINPIRLKYRLNVAPSK